MLDWRSPELHRCNVSPTCAGALGSQAGKGKGHCAGQELKAGEGAWWHVVEEAAFMDMLSWSQCPPFRAMDCIAWPRTAAFQKVPWVKLGPVGRTLVLPRGGVLSREDEK